MIGAHGLRPSPLDSARFGIVVERIACDGDVDLTGLLQAIQRSSADLIILRTDAGQSEVATALQQQGEFVIHADTLVYYGMPLQPLMGHTASNVRAATETDRHAIAMIAKAGFHGYRSHYSANPLLPQQWVEEGYVEWAQSRLADADYASATWVVTDGDDIAGFATCDRHGDMIDIVLNAVHPAFERRGHYGALLGHLIRHYGNLALQRLVISTQIWNYGVQRQWTKAGLRLYSAMDTYHIDRRLIGRSGSTSTRVL